MGESIRPSTGGTRIYITDPDDGERGAIPDWLWVLLAIAALVAVFAA